MAKKKKGNKSKLTKKQKQLAADLAWLLDKQHPERRQSHINKFKNNPQEYLRAIEREEQELRAVPVALLASGIFTAITSGWVLGALAIVSGLVQSWLSPKPEAPRERAPDPKFARGYAGTIGSLATYQQSIPAIFCSRSLDSTGGVQTGGDMIYGKIVTKDGSQTAKIRWIISHGEIGNIDLDRTILNEQPISYYNNQSISLTWQPGNQTQTVPAGFNEFCQNVQAQGNNLAGARLVSSVANGTITLNVVDASVLTVGGTYWVANPIYPITITAISGNTITTTFPGYYTIGDTISNLTTIASLPSTTTEILVVADDFEAYAGNNEYYAISGNTVVKFKVTNRERTVINNTEYFSISTNPAIPSPCSIYSLTAARYQTTKRVTEAHLNLNCNVWARNSSGEIIDFLQLYTLKGRKFNSGAFVPIAHFYIRSTNSEQIYRAIEIINLPLSPYGFEVTAEFLLPTDTLPIYSIEGTGPINTYTSSVDIGGGVNPSLRFQGLLTTLTGAQITALMDQSKARTPQNSPQQGQTLAIQNVNEVESVAASGKTYDLSLKGLATVEAIVTFGPQINGSANFLFFVTEGIITDKLLAAGTAGAASTTTVLDYPPGHGQTFAAGLTLRNARKRIEATVTAMTTTTITTATPLNWEQGDMWYLAGKHSTCWLPEIYSHLCIDPKFGASRRIIGDYFLDWPELVKNTRWVEGTNEHNQFFAWHGKITDRQRLNTWINEQAPKVMLKTVFSSRKAFEPHRTPINMPAPVIYNASNAKDFRLQYTTLDRDPINSIVVTHTRIEPALSTEDALVSNPQAVSAETWDMLQNNRPIKRQTFQNPECTSPEQAKKTAQLLLQIARHEGRIAAEWSAVDVEAIGLRPGHAARLQTAETNYKAEFDGVVVETTATAFRLDRSFTLAEGLTTDPNPAGLTDWNKDFISLGVAIGDVVKNLETGATSIVTAVSQRSLDCSPIIPADTQYSIQDLTTTGLVICTPGQAPRPFTATLTAGKVWYSVAGVQPEVTDPVAAGTLNVYDRYFKIVRLISDFGQAETDNGRARKYGTAITASNWTPKLFDFSDVQVSDRDGVYNPAP